LFARLRRFIRRFVPRLLDPWLDAPIVNVPRDAAFAAAYTESLAPFERNDPHAEARYYEGTRWRGVMEKAQATNGVILDLGSGSGGVTLALAAANYRVASVDYGWSETARLAHKRSGVPYRHVVADAAHLPFRGGAFSSIICIDTFEHFPDAPAAGREAGRVLRDDGQIVMTTPARLGWIFRRDPHFNIRFLLLFPPSIQRKIAARRGFGAPHHFVDRIYTDARALERMFPHSRITRTLKRSRLPARWFWEALILRKVQSR
jgi:SAM-dependent methyltransferase